MQKSIKQLQHKGRILKTILIFIVSYLIFLVLWIQVEGYYVYAVTYIASGLVTNIKDVKFEEMGVSKDIIQSTFSPLRHKSDILIDIPVKVSSYTFNSPLTFAIMASLYPFIRRRKRAYAEAVLIIFAVHLLYVSSLELKDLSEIFMDRGIEAMSKQCMFGYQFMWGFVDNMVIRFEPFLIGFYLYMRFR